MFQSEASRDIAAEIIIILINIMMMIIIIIIIKNIYKVMPI